MPNNIGSKGLTDREIAQLCLELEKNRCRSVSHTILEASNEQLRQIYSQCQQQYLAHQQDLYELMNERGWYTVDDATPEEIGEVQGLMQQNLNPGRHQPQQ
ncbi:spore coat protein [Desertibacillus haloalkaliphilus]|uniref:spore coat protein n=1 Tax=Desertibacillus haloalkaliphilus TaxID=1328930 RepID=UPI001C275D86|nr:spore coat protein [Desertibacillus haloalkaliphilus]MBU8908034.1 spore coat protein [Desertibacillus haloalkaliphilus]